MAEIQGDALRGHLEDLILAVLRSREAHGFEILRRLELAGEGALRLKEGTLYPALRRLDSILLVAPEIYSSLTGAALLMPVLLRQASSWRLQLA